MKKILIILGIIVVVIIGIVLTVFNIINKEKTPISTDKFYAIMEDKNYEMIDVTGQFAQYGNYVSKGYIAYKTNYQIEFYELSSVENAIDMFKTNKGKFELQKGEASTDLSIDISNYNKYSLTANGKYKYVSRIDNTLVYVDVDESYKDIVKDIMKEIGY